MPRKLVINEKTAGFTLGAICLIVAAALLFEWKTDGDLRSKLQETGKTTQASVVAARSRSVSSGRRSSTEEYLLSVFFLVDLEGVSKEFKVTREGFVEHPQGSKVAVLYDPNNPEDAILNEEFALGNAGSGWIGGAIFGVCALGLFGYAVRSKQTPTPPVER